MPKFDIADENDPNTLRVPFIFVPAGDPLPIEWMRDHPGWVRIPARWVPRPARDGESGEQWDVSLDLPNEDHESIVQSVEPAPPAGKFPAPGLFQATGGASSSRPIPPTPIGYDIADRAVAAYLQMSSALENPADMLGFAKGKSASGPIAEGALQTAKPIVGNGVQLAASGDLKCEGYSAGCQAGGSWGKTAMYRILGRNLCQECAVKILGIENDSNREKTRALQPFELNEK